MWRKPLARVAVAVAALALSLDGCGGHTRAASTATHSTAGSGSGRGLHALSVDPRSGRSTTAFTFGFVVPDAAGRRGNTRLGYELGVLGPERAGCLTPATVAVPAFTAGVRAMVTLAPGATGGRWCVGTYRARVTETATPVCAPGTMCPQFIRVVRTVANGTFRILGP